MTGKFNLIDKDDVISSANGSYLKLSRTFKADELTEKLKSLLIASTNCDTGLFSSGMRCEVLIIGTKGWQKGKVKISLQFCPDQTSESTSPLDDIRQNLKKTES